MVGSQMEDLDGWMARLARSAANYCRLRQRVPTLRAFNFGGGMPTSAYALDFAFDYQSFLRRLMAELAATCAAVRCAAARPDRRVRPLYRRAHNCYLLEIGSVKHGQATPGTAG